MGHNVYDHTSILKMIEWRWNLPPITTTSRDATANNITEVLDFSKANRNAPDFRVPAGPFGAICAPAGLASTARARDNEWMALRAIAQNYGWPVGS